MKRRLMFACLLFGHNDTGGEAFGIRSCSGITPASLEADAICR